MGIVHQVLDEVEVCVGRNSRVRMSRCKIGRNSDEVYLFYMWRLTRSLMNLLAVSINFYWCKTTTKKVYGGIQWVTSIHFMKGNTIRTEVYVSRLFSV